jgi:hypothetical protein
VATAAPRTKTGRENPLLQIGSIVATQVADPARAATGAVTPQIELKTQLSTERRAAVVIR